MTEDQTTDKTEDKSGEQHPDRERQDDTGTDEVSKLRREAASYRRKLRETETERDRLVARLDDVQRAEVEREVTQHGGLESGKDFWTAGVKLEELRDEDGSLDSEKIKEARTRVISEHPNWAAKPPQFDGGPREPAPEDKTPSFGAELKKAGQS